MIIQHWQCSGTKQSCKFWRYNTHVYLWKPNKTTEIQPEIAATGYVAAGGLCSIPVVSNTHDWQSMKIRSQSLSLLFQQPASVSISAVWFKKGGCDSICPSFWSVHTVNLPFVINYKCKAKQQNAQFEGTMKTEVYFPNDWSRSKI